LWKILAGGLGGPAACGTALSFCIYFLLIGRGQLNLIHRAHFRRRRGGFAINFGSQPRHPGSAARFGTHGVLSTNGGAASSCRHRRSSAAAWVYDAPSRTRAMKLHPEWMVTAPNRQARRSPMNQSKSVNRSSRFHPKINPNRQTPFANPTLYGSNRQ
jgi:hypothetical protein